MPAGLRRWWPLLLASLVVIAIARRMGVPPFQSAPAPRDTGAGAGFLNWETPPVHPIDLSPDGARLAVVNLPDHRLEIFDVSGGFPEPRGSIPVGLDPVSARWRTPSEVWVVNQISDSVSVVDVERGIVVATLQTWDEPADVVFAGSPPRAFVSCSQANVVLVFDPADLGSAPLEVPIEAEEPRGLAVSPDGGTVYAAIFESGNATTIIPGGTIRDYFTRRGVNDPEGPYGGRNPPPNGGGGFEPQLRAGLPPPPPSSLIVRRDEAGRWWDDNGGEWTRFVSGDKAPTVGRPVGWDLPDRDLAVIDASTLEVRYVSGLMNLCMTLSVRPTDGTVWVAGTEATNEVRFEPNLRGRFLRVLLARIDPSASTNRLYDLNPHLDYTLDRVPSAERRRSLADPRAIAWTRDGLRGFAAGMGSNNVVVLGADGRRAPGPPIEVGEGPAGLALDESRGRLYVLNRFEASLSVLDLTSLQEVGRCRFFDPTPEVVRRGRRHFYNTHETSGLGHVACASCHVDARTDRLAWDLGDPAGELQALEGQNLGLSLEPLMRGVIGVTGLEEGFAPFHPMKGPMLTQTLQDLIGHEPFHWRGDRAGLEAFSQAFVSLLGGERMLSPAEMQDFEDFLATIALPPNPFREPDNGLPERLRLAGHYSTGRFEHQPDGLRAGDPLPVGNAREGLRKFRTLKLSMGEFPCVQCHALPAGAGSPMRWNGRRYVGIPPGPLGENHAALVANDALGNTTMKIPQLRTLYDRVGFEVVGVPRAGFGFTQDGDVPTLAAFIAREAFDVTSDQDVADLLAFLLAFSGGDFPPATGRSPEEPPGLPSKDTHAAVGRQATLKSPDEVQAWLRLMLDLASPETGRVDLIARGLVEGRPRGWWYDRAEAKFVSDRRGEDWTVQTLIKLAAPETPLTLTVVPVGHGRRLGIDRDEDGWPDQTETEAGTNPADAGSWPEGR